MIFKSIMFDKSGIEKTDAAFIMKRRKQVIIMINCRSIV